MFRKILVAGAVSAMAVCGTAAAQASPGTTAAKQLAHAKAVNSKYVQTGKARAAGYGLLKDAAGIECIADPMGGMGVHLVNGKLVGDGAIKANTPEALVYEPDKNGRLHLVAAEYVVLKAAWDAKHSTPPSLFGHRFVSVAAGNRYGLPAFYELHTWSWKANPMGTFMNYNPKVSCAGSTELYR
jgi:hypothetical protein